VSFFERNYLNNILIIFPYMCSCYGVIIYTYLFDLEVI